MGWRAGRATPSMAIEPLSGLTTPAITLMRVDLPEPFSPARQWISPRRMVSETLFEGVHAREPLVHVLQREEGFLGHGDGRAAAPPGRGRRRPLSGAARS